MLLRILIAAGTEHLNDRIASLVTSENLICSRAIDETGVWESLGHDSFDLVIAGEEIASGSAMPLIQALRELPDHPAIIVLRQREDALERARLLTDGALAVLNLGLPDAVLAETMRSLLERRREQMTGKVPADQVLEPYRLSDFSSASPAMRQLLDLARRVVDADTSLVISGETGVGKEWLARAIHEEGRRSPHPFIAVNCAAVPETLLESELFGHEKGAFTGSIRAHRGHFELAHRGTLFLDEIAEMPLHLQAKLLRVVQDRSIQRLGAEAPIAVDVRIMAATNRGLDQAIADGSFRRDLFYRLSVVTLHVPPLRDRREDIEPLATGYLQRFSNQFGRALAGIDDEAMDALQTYHWPGNVRELINVMERAVLLSRGGKLGLADLPEGLAPRRPPFAGARNVEWPEHEDADAWLNRPLRELRREVVSSVERRYLAAQLARHGGRIGDTARASGLDPRSLYEKLRRLGLQKEDYRGA